MSQKGISKARALWPFVGGYVSQASGTRSAVDVLLVGDPNSILQFQDEDLGKDVPYKDEINIHANAKFVELDTGSTAFGAVYVYDTFAPLVGASQVSTVGSTVTIGFKERGPQGIISLKSKSPRFQRLALWTTLVPHLATSHQGDSGKEQRKKPSISLSKTWLGGQW